MSSSKQWWDASGFAKGRTLFPWPWLRQPQAQPAQRLTLSASELPDTGSTFWGACSPCVVASLPVGAVGSVGPVTSVVFDRPSRPQPGPSALRPKDEQPTALGNGRPPGASAPGRSSLAERLRLILSPPLDALLPGPNSILRWPNDLMPFQLDGVRTLLQSAKLLLADDMGLGKTIQVIVALRILFVQRAIESALIVAPASVLDQWRQELHKWAPELRGMTIRGNVMERGWLWKEEVHVAIVSYETLRSDLGDNLQSPVRGKTWDVLVADEAQRIKNRNATSTAVKAVQRHRSWALTGTPVENNEEELASVVEFVDHGDRVSQDRYYPGLKLRERHRELQLRRKKGDVLQDLPPKLTTKLPIELLPSQRKSYDRALHEGIVHLRALGAEVRVQHVLELISRLKQICNADPATGKSSKFEDIRQRIDTLAGQDHRAIVFSQYTTSGFGVDGISEMLRDFNPLVFTGALALEEKRDVIRRFRADDGHRVLVVSLRAGGVGLNLQEASYVFHLDRWWNPAVERQAEDRSHRYGQTVPVHVFKYSCIDTIEERIDRILEQKQELFNELVDDVSMDLAATLSADELFGLVGL